MKTASKNQLVALDKAKATMLNRRFGRLVVINFSDSVRVGKQNKRFWVCLCDCGKESIICGNNLKTGKTKSCGCSRNEHKRKYPGKKGSYENSKAKSLKKLYNLTLEEYNKILAEQQGVCAISGKTPSNTKSLSVDHDHKTGRIRGLLDWKINQALEAFKDDPNLLRRAADYLENPPAPRILGKETFGLLGRAKIKKVMIYGNEKLLRTHGNPK